MAWRKRLVVCAAIASAAAARADVLVDTFDAGTTFGGTSAEAAESQFGGGSGLGLRLAVRFTVPSTSSVGYTLDSIVVPLSQNLVNVSQNLLRVRIAADSGNGLSPGATLEVLSQNQPVPNVSTPFTAVTTYPSSAHPMLAPGGRYWIITELTARPSSSGSFLAEYRWWQSASGASSVYVEEVTNGLPPTDPWPSSTTSLNAGFRVTGTPLAAVACCNAATGGCGMASVPACQSMGLAAQALGSVCTPNPCAAMGACCQGTTCTLGPASACTGTATFLGAGAACAPTVRGGQTNACCPADFSNSGGLAVADIFAFLNAWFAGCP
jgi:hypothetical protein